MPNIILKQNAPIKLTGGFAANSTEGLIEWLSNGLRDGTLELESAGGFQFQGIIYSEPFTASWRPELSYGEVSEKYTYTGPAYRVFPASGRLIGDDDPQ